MKMKPFAAGFVESVQRIQGLRESCFFAPVVKAGRKSKKPVAIAASAMSGISTDWMIFITAAGVPRKNNF